MNGRGGEPKLLDGSSRRNSRVAGRRAGPVLAAGSGCTKASTISCTSGIMRFHTYQKYQGTLLDAVNIQDLLERLADFLLQSGFEGGPHYHPWWGWSGDSDDRSLDSLKAALLQALLESGQLTPEMLAELRGEGGDEEV